MGKNIKKTLCTVVAVLMLSAIFTSCVDINRADSSAGTTSAETTANTSTEGTPSARSIYAEVIALYENLPSAGEPCPEGADETLVNELCRVLREWGSLYSGYCFKDINRDGTEEMIFLNSDYELQAILTQVDDKVKFVTMFYPNGFGGFIDENGVIYNSNTGKYLSWFESTGVLSDNGELKYLSYYGFRNNTGKAEDGEYFKKTANGDYMPATQEEINEFTKQSVYFESPNTSAWKESLKKSFGYTPFDISPL